MLYNHPDGVRRKPYTLVWMIIIRARPIKKTRKVKGSRPDCAFCVQLIHFMVERDLLNLSTDVGVTEEGPVVLKKGRAYIIRHCYVICNLSFFHLPQSAEGLQTY